MTPVELAILLSALAFVVLVIFLARALHKTSKTLERIQKQLDDLGNEPKEFLQHTNQIASDIQSKMKCLDPLFYALSNVGEGLEYKTSAFRDISLCRCCRAKLDSANTEQESTVMKYAHLALMGASLWNDLQKGK